MVVNQSLREALSCSHTKENLFYQENQFDDTNSFQNVEASPNTEKILKLIGADWTGVFNDLKNAIKIRHYSPETLRTNRGWPRKFQTFHQKQRSPNGSVHILFVTVLPVIYFRLIPLSFQDELIQTINVF